MYCPSCHERINDNSRYCQFCGAEVLYFNQSSIQSRSTHQREMIYQIRMFYQAIFKVVLLKWGITLTGLLLSLLLFKWI